MKCFQLKNWLNSLFAFNTRKKLLILLLFLVFSFLIFAFEGWSTPTFYEKRTVETISVHIERGEKVFFQSPSTLFSQTFNGLTSEREEKLDSVLSLGALFVFIVL